MFSRMKQKRFVRRIARKMLKTHRRVLKDNPNIDKLECYKSVLLQTDGVQAEQIDKILWQAEDSVDRWTTSSTECFGLRQIVHFVVMSQHREAGNAGAEVSFRDIVYSIVPEKI